MKKTTVFTFFLIIVLSVSGCNPIESIKWFIGAVDYGKIRGTVTDIEGNPVEGMTVNIYPESITTGIEPETDETGKDGKYIVSKLIPGTYRVEIIKDAYEYFNEGGITVIEAEISEVDFEDVMRVDVNNWYRFEEANPYGKDITNEYYAQSFKPGVSIIRKVNFFIFGAANSYELELKADSAGKPGSVLGSGSVVSCYNTVSILLSEPVEVIIGQTYWLVVHTLSANCHFLAEDVYSDGELKYSSDGSNWSDAVPEEMTFITFY